MEIEILKLFLKIKYQKCSDYDCNELAVGETTVAGKFMPFCIHHLMGENK